MAKIRTYKPKPKGPYKCARANVIWLYKKGYPEFCLNFEDKVRAKQWLEKHEKSFYKDPEYYFRWREELYLLIKENGLKSLYGIKLSSSLRKDMWQPEKYCFPTKD